MSARLLRALTILLLAGCRPGEQRGAPLFKLLTPRQTGVTFANTITPTDSLNAVTDAYIYNGAGVGVGDIDNDGRPDLFFAGNMVSSRLYLNKGNMRFEDITAAAGVATRGWASGVTMVDINHDGWLDIYVSRSGPEWSTPAERANLLYRNNGDGTFTNVSTAAGILRHVGYGLGVAVADINGDGWPDIYVSNDITPNDVLYINQRNGTFRDMAGAWLKHTSYAGMGVDIADFNGDGRPDIVQADMMPAAWEGRKRVSMFLTYGNVVDLQHRGFRTDYEMNALQLNNGGPDTAIVFSEIARMAGVAYTDWSWSPLFADFDNDGLKDLFVSNGYPKGVNDTNYNVAVFAAQRAKNRRRQMELLEKLPAYRV